MKLFGIEIKRQKSKVLSITDKPVSISGPVEPTASPYVSSIRSVKSPVMTFAQSRASGRGQVLAPEYDLVEIGLVEDADSFVRQAFQKKLALMFKEGYGFTGANKRTVQYIKARMAQCARAGNIPTAELLKSIGRSLIRVSNAFLIKKRDKKASGGRVRKTIESKQLEPVAAYFPAAPETMFPEINQDTGSIVRWKQQLPDGRFKYFNKEDVIHFYIDRREGFLFGVPSLVPVIDDIRALRQLEENIELLLYQHLFPLFQWKVGTPDHPAGFDESGQREIDVAREQIRLMPAEGGIVTSERHDVKAIGSEGRAIRAEGYLDHFKKRVIAGLGISQIDLGDGDTTNRSTANTLSRQLIDTIKDIQDAFEIQFDQYVLSELLLESTFGEDILEEKNRVHLRFEEIDIQNRMDLEQHYVKLFEANGLTYDEFREKLNYEPIPVPEDPDDQDPAKYPEWFGTYWKLFEEPLNLIRAVDEPFSESAQAAAAARSTNATSQQLKTSQQAQIAAQERELAARKTAQAKTKKDNYIHSQFANLEQETKVRIQTDWTNRRRVDYDYLTSHARAWATEVSKEFLTFVSVEFQKGFTDEFGYRPRSSNELYLEGRKVLQNRIERLVNRLAVQTIRLIQRRAERNPTLTEFTQEVTLAFESNRYRTDFMWDAELRKAYNFGRLKAAQSKGFTGVQNIPTIDACPRCKAASETTIPLSHVSLSDIIPVHAGCFCDLKFIN